MRAIQCTHNHLVGPATTFRCALAFLLFSALITSSVCDLIIFAPENPETSRRAVRAVAELAAMPCYHCSPRYKPAEAEVMFASSPTSTSKAQNGPDDVKSNLNEKSVELQRRLDAYATKFVRRGPTYSAGPPSSSRVMTALFALEDLYCKQHSIAPCRRGLKRLRSSLMDAGVAVNVCVRCSHGLGSLEDVIATTVRRASWSAIPSIAALVSPIPTSKGDSSVVSGGGLRHSTLLPELLNNCHADKYGVLPAVLPLLWSPNEVLFEEVRHLFCDR